MSASLMLMKLKFLDGNNDFSTSPAQMLINKSTRYGFCSLWVFSAAIVCAVISLSVVLLLVFILSEPSIYGLFMFYHLSDDAMKINATFSIIKIYI